MIDMRYENMKNTCKSKKEGTDSTKKYAFFSDPDVIARRTQTFATKSQDKEDCVAHQERQCFDAGSSSGRLSNAPVSLDLKGLENLFTYPVQGYPFPFISAVKRKLALNDYSDGYKKTYQPSYIMKREEPIQTLGLCQVVQKMNFMQALNVPEHSTRESPVSRLLVTAKPDVPKQSMYDTMDRSTKNIEKVQRKLDFSISDSSSIISGKNVEPLKVPNLSIASNLSRKKEHTKENFREKENRSKKIKRDEVPLDFNKRSKSPKCVSRWDYSDDTSDASLTKIKNDKSSFHIPRENVFLPIKPKSKNVATSTIKKENEKRQRLSNIRSSKTPRDVCLESKPKAYSNESISDHSSELLDKITVRELSRNASDNVEHRYKDEYHTLCDSRQGKQKKQLTQSHGKALCVSLKDQGKKTQEKGRSSIKHDVKHLVSNTEESEDIESITVSNTSLLSVNPSSNIQVPYIKHKEDSLQQWNAGNISKGEGPFTQTVNSNQTSTENELNSLDESILPEALLDRRRISFRDENRSPQEEFHDLVTPTMNLVVKSKRRKQFLQNDTELDDTKISSKNVSGMKADVEQESIQIMHPTALHMQFQAELHLLDSVDESFRKVMNVENSLFNVERDQKKDLPSEQKKSDEELQPAYTKLTEKNNINVELLTSMSKLHKQTVDESVSAKIDMHNNAHLFTDQAKISDFNDGETKLNKPMVKAVEVQTQTVNDMGTQTDLRPSRHMSQVQCPDICGITIERGFTGNSKVPQYSLDSVEHFEDLDQIEDMSLPNKLRTMSEISLHETTSSIKTETGTEISISTRDVTCSFNKYLDLEMAQLIKDEKQMYDKIQMLFKSREKTLNDRTKKLVKLEEQKRALKDTGQDSRISSVKKKQRALLLKLQQEKDEMNRLKELHKIASQERKLMLQKQRNMFNPHMSTKNILTKLKRSADCSSPRRLSGPMKGYDIRSNSSMSSLVDSDKSQHERSQADTRLQISDNDIQFSKLEDPEFSVSFTETNKSNDLLQNSELKEKCLCKSPKDGSKLKYELKSKKFEEKMPRTDILRIKTQSDVESKLVGTRPMNISEQYFFEREIHSDSSQISQLNKSVTEQQKPESDTILEEFSRNRTQQNFHPSERSTMSKSTTINTEIIPEDESILDEDMKMTKSSQVSEDISQSFSRSSKKSSKTILSEIQSSTRKSQSISDLKSSSKRKSPKCQKNKSSSSTLSDNIPRSKSGCQLSEEFSKQNSKHNSISIEKELTESDYHAEDTVLDSTGLNETLFRSISRHSKTVKDKNCRLLTDSDNNYEAKENVCKKGLSRNIGTCQNYCDRQQKSPENGENIASKSQVSTVTISRHSSGESERNYSKSVVVRSHGSEFKTSKKLEQILNAREAALANRRNCIEDWMAWHAKLRAEEDRLARMEQATLKLVTAASNVFSQQERSVCPLIDTTISSDTSDVEGRIELLTEKVQEQRMEMSRLKREARKQAKQKLRAFEANLLNQIKKYDTTIHEMRKKLESRKGFDKDGEKSSGELKSWVDFKIPEIPVRRIQDICKNTDLLRSRSESDLLCSKKQRKDITSNIRNEILRHTRNKVENDQYGEGEQTKYEHRPELVNIFRTEAHRSTQSITDESISEQIEDEKSGIASVLSTSDEIATEKHTYSASPQSTTTGKITEDIKTDMGSTKFESERSIILDAYMSKHINVDPNQAPAKPISLHSINTEKRDLEYSHTFTEISDYCESVNTEIETASKVDIESGTDYDASDFSKNIDYVQWNNQNLNKNIISLENDVKTLTEMVTRFSKNINEKKVGDKGKLCSTFHDEAKNVSNIVKSSAEEKKLPQEKDVNTSHNSEYTQSTSKSSINNVEKLIPIVMPKDDISMHETNQDIIDYEAKSKEILNEIEKSIVSEHTKGSDFNCSSASVSYENTGFESRTATSRKNKDFNKSVDNSAFEDALTTTPIEEILAHSKTLSATSDIRSEDTFRQDFENIKSKEKVSGIFLSEVEKVNDSLDIKADEKTITNETLNKIFNVNQINLGFSDTMEAAQLSDHANASSKELEFMPVSEKSFLPESLSELRNVQVSSDNKTRQPEVNYSVNDGQTDEGSSLDIKEISTHKFNDASSYPIISQDIVSTTNEDSLKEFHRDNSLVDNKDWTVSDSFNVPRDTRTADTEESLSHYSNYENDGCLDIQYVSKPNDESNLPQQEENAISDTEDISVFIPKGESTNIEMHGLKFDETLSVKPVDMFDDILNVTAKESDEDICQPANVSSGQSELSQEINQSVSGALDAIEESSGNDSIIENIDEYDEEKRTEKKEQLDMSITDKYSATDDRQLRRNEIDINDNESQNNNIVGKTHVINIEVHPDVEENRNILQMTNKLKNIITEFKASTEGKTLPEVQLDTKVKLADDNSEDINSAVDQGKKLNAVCQLNKEIKVYETVRSDTDIIRDQDSSDGEQLDNLVEVVESELDTIEKEIDTPTPCELNPATIVNVEQQNELGKLRKVNVDLVEKLESIEQYGENSLTPKSTDVHTCTETLVTISVSGRASKTTDVLKDPEYEDISEESLEVSEILEKTEHSKSIKSQKVSSNTLENYQSLPRSDEVLKILDTIAPKLLIDSAQLSSCDASTQDGSVTNGQVSIAQFPKTLNVESTALRGQTETEEIEHSRALTITHDDMLGVYSKSEEISRHQSEEETSDKPDQDTSSDSNEGGDSSKILSEIESDSPRDTNDVKLDIDDSSEKEIAVMINELKASLEQPGLESADLEAKVLQLKRLQIELEIKALVEAKGMPYYVREIPNKPPPPYTPPGENVRIPLPPASPLPPPGVVPSNVEELTNFTEKATAIIFDAKLTGEDVMSMEPPSEIYKPTKESNETVSHDKRVYHTFLFNLCKEIIAEVYKSEYENPGPSWTKPNVTTKPTIRLPKTLDELKEHVNKEVATLFGFKTKMQRENMVMQWIRKRRDRVDELLAREAQAEEDEWTKFHHDELTVKNSLTIAILDTLTMETVREVKVAYAKKRKSDQVLTNIPPSKIAQRVCKDDNSRRRKLM